MKQIKLFFLVLNIFSLLSPLASTPCYENQVKEANIIEEDGQRFAWITFQKEVNGNKRFKFKEIDCGMFYDSYICEYKTEELPGWSVRSDLDMKKDWYIRYCE